MRTWINKIPATQQIIENTLPNSLQNSNSTLINLISPTQQIFENTLPNSLQNSNSNKKIKLIEQSQIQKLKKVGKIPQNNLLQPLGKSF